MEATVSESRSGWRKTSSAAKEGQHLAEVMRHGPNGGNRRTRKTGRLMYVVLDTNHFAELVHGTERGERLNNALPGIASKC